MKEENKENKNEKAEEKKESNRQKQKTEQNETFDVEVGEDSTKYGEFISSFFAWIPLSEQKEKAQRFQNITKKEK